MLLKMGWTFTHKEKGTSVRKFLVGEFEFEDQKSGRYLRIVDCAVVHLTEAYLAIERGNGTGEKEISAVVCLLQYRPNDYYNFGYKEISEEEGPYYYNCPERILCLLTPPKNEWAREWRQKCQENMRAKASRPRLRKGLVIRFAEPIEFRNGVKCDTFRVEDPRRLHFADRFGFRYKISRYILDRVRFEALGENFPLSVGV